MSALYWSLNEVEANCRNAARGLGLSWGIAEEAGRAARWLSEQGLPGARCVATVLSRIDPDNHRRMAPVSADALHANGGVALCPILTGTVLSDGTLGPDPVRIGPILCPVLLLPFVASLDRPVTLRWSRIGIGVDGRRLWVAGRRAELLCDGCDGIELSPGLPDAPVWDTRQRYAIAPPAATILRALAERTFAPATDESRMAGAGGAEDQGVSAKT